MDTKKLLLAMRLRDTLHFGKAAEIENIAQSGLSVQIGKLEQEIGFKIFIRASRRVTLTEAGEKFLDKAQWMLDEMQKSISDCKALSLNKRRILRIGFFADQASDYTYPLFSLFQKMNPEIQLTFVELQMNNQVQSLIADNVDVVLLRLPIYDERLEYVELFNESRVAVVPASHELANRETLSVRDLLDKPFAIPAEGTPPDLVSYWSLADVRNEPSRIASFVKSIPEVLTAVCYGGAFDTFPASLIKSYQHPGVRYIPLPDASVSTLSLATLAGNRRPEIRSLRACASQIFNVSI